jgi:enoyl-CoA hydratase/carnithine racemase
MTVPASTGQVTLSVAAGVATVELNNPSQRNALTRSMCLELQALMPRLDADPNVVVVALRGAGDTFCAGAALSELSSVLLDEQSDGSRVDQLSRADDAITSAAKPTIALVDGACIGGGWQIASACDFVLASARSTIAITPAKLGIIYPRAGIDRLVRQVGPARAKFILFAGEVFSAVDAQALGLIAEAIADAEFEARSLSLLATVASRSQFSVHTLKHLVDLNALGGPDVDGDWNAAWLAMERGPDMAIGVSAFLNHERPRFTWTPASDATPDSDGARAQG